MKSKDNIEIGDRFNHKMRGLCTFTEVAFALELMNPDVTSIFVLFDDETDEIEVSIGFLEKVDFEPPRICQLCFKPLVDTDINLVCRLCSLGIKNKLEN